MSTFIPLIRQTMQPLAAAYGLREVFARETDMDDTLVFANATTGVEVQLDWFDFYPFVRLFQLVEGLTPPYPSRVAESSGPGGHIDADGLLALLGVSGPPIGARLERRDPDEVRPVLEAYAAALSRHAGDVFRGDFSAFAEIARRGKSGSTEAQ